MERADHGHDFGGGILVGLAAKGDNLLAVLGAIRGRYARVAVLGGRSGDMGSRDSEDIIVVQKIGLGIPGHLCLWKRSGQRRQRRQLL